jgi:carbonic anhydrase
MRSILRGIAHFRRHVYPDQAARFKDLTHGQSPEILFITCSDSRIDPSLITQSEPGELFIVRNAGNLIPPWGSGDGSTAAAIEYAVEALNVQHIVVCGHAHCGAMAALHKPESLENLPAVRRWLSLAEPAKRYMQRNHPHLTGEDRLNKTIERNALIQLDNLRTHPSVAAKIAEGSLELHAWVYDIGQGEIREWDFAAKHYTPIVSPDDAEESSALLAVQPESA